MIFISVGTEKFPFDRLLQIIDHLVETGMIRQPVFAQTGNSRYRPERYDYVDFMPFIQMKENIEKADMIIMHAGVGSTLLCLQSGKIPILFPRRHQFKEHLDEHQFEFCKRIKSTGKVFVAFDEDELKESIINYHALVFRAKEAWDSDEERNQLSAYLRKRVLI